MKIGSTDISAAYLGSTALQKVYVGSTEVWSAVDTDAAAFFARVTTAGGSLSATEQTAVNTLVVQMKADGIWSKMKAVYPFVGGSASSCAQNLRSSSFTAIFSNGWTFSSNGGSVSGAGTMNTNLVPSLNFSDEKISLSTYVANYTTNITIGAIDSPRHIYDWRSSSFMSMYNGTGVPMDAISNGFGILSRLNTTQVQYKNNGNSLQTISQDYIGMCQTNIHIGSFGGDSFFSTGQYRFGHIGELLTTQNQADFYTAVQAFQTTLSRQV